MAHKFATPRGALKAWRARASLCVARPIRLIGPVAAVLPVLIRRLGGSLRAGLADENCVCVVDAKGKIVRETKIKSEPETLVAFLHGLGIAIKRVGLEAGPLSQWLHAGLIRAGFETVLLETRHVKAALSAMTVKTDRKDARGIAQLLRMGRFRPVHCKSPGCAASD